MKKSFFHLNVRIFFLVLVLAITACTKEQVLIPQAPPPPPEPKQEEVKKTNAEIFWEKYLATADTKMEPFRTQFTLRYGVEGKTDRASALLWGNSSKEIRLDINAGVGVNVAKIYEGPKEFSLYLPRDKAAYLYSGKEKPLLKVGVPMPLGLAQLTQLHEGAFAQVFGKKQLESVKPKDAKLPANILEELPKDAEAYVLDSETLAGTLVLNSEGLPLYWLDAEKDGWSIDFSYKDGEKSPYKLNINHIATKRRALILIRERSSGLANFASSKLRLTYPRGTKVQGLDKLGKS